jgi:hypothetical protein
LRWRPFAAAHARAWLILAVAAEICAGAVGLLNDDAVGRSLVVPSVVGVVLLLLVRTRHAWAWWMYVTLNAVGFVSMTIVVLLGLVTGMGRAEISGLGLTLSLVAFGAIFAPGVRPDGGIPARSSPVADADNSPKLTDDVSQPMTISGVPADRSSTPPKVYRTTR